MAAKKIDIGDGYQVQFITRANGVRSRAWVGLVFKDGIELGSFANGGAGGTTWFSPEAERALEALIDRADPVDGPGICHRANAVIAFAEAKGYMKLHKETTLVEFVQIWIKMM